MLICNLLSVLLQVLVFKVIMLVYAFNISVLGYKSTRIYKNPEYESVCIIFTDVRSC